jgi:hypothetical protein
MSEKYYEMRRRQQEEFNQFPISFAFSDKQFKEGMERLGLSPEDTDKVCGVGGGGFIRKTDKDDLIDLLETHNKEIKTAIAKDETGEGFIFEMFLYELNNHEYGYTGDITDTVHSLGLTIGEVKNDPKLMHGLNLAMERCN